MFEIIILLSFLCAIIISNLLVKYYLSILFPKYETKKERKTVVKSKLAHKL